MAKASSSPTPPAADPTVRKGKIVIKKINYHRPENGYSIVQAIAPEGTSQEPFTYKGTFEGLVLGATYEVEVTLEKSKPPYGNNYLKVHKSTPISHEMSPEGMVTYLCREGPQLGDVRAKELVDKLGSKVVEILANNPSYVAGVLPSIPKDRLEQLHVWAKDELLLSQVKAKLYEWKFTPGLITKIIMAYGRNTVEVLKKDPYRITDIKGIGWKLASKVGDAVGCSPTDKRRLQAGVLFLMEEIQQEGSVCCPADKLLRKAEELLGVGRDALVQAIKDLVTEEKLCTQHTEAKRFAKNKSLFDAEFPVES